MKAKGDYLAEAIAPQARPSDSAIAKLEQFATLVQKWNPAINVVAKSTIYDLWMRHIVDSAQLFSVVTPEYHHWLDIGSGGGFPGIVIAALAADLHPQMKVSLVESDKRKAVFLMEAARLLGLSVAIHTARIEELSPQNACIVSARALAPLSSLCGLAARHVRTGGICAFLKGASVDLELDEARQEWKFALDRVQSVTDSKASLLFLRSLAHV